MGSSKTLLELTLCMEILAGVDPMETLERENDVREHSSIAKIAMRSVKALFVDVSSSANMEKATLKGSM